MRIPYKEACKALKALTRYTRIGKSVDPELGAISLETSKGSLLFSVGDTRVKLRIGIEGHGELGGHAYVDGKKLKKVLSAAKDGSVDFECLSEELRVTIGKRKFILPKLDSCFPTEFSPSRKSGNSQFPADELIAAMEYTAPAVSGDITRSTICCARWETCRMIATDGHRLHIAPCPQPPTENAAYLYPEAMQSLIECAKSFGADEIECQDWKSFLRFRWEFAGVSVVLDTLNEEIDFPPYDKVVPENHTHQFEVSATELNDALLAAKKMNNGDPERAAELDLVAGELRVGNKEFSEILRATLCTPGNPAPLRINPAYGIDALRSMDGVVLVRSQESELDPIMFVSGDLLAVVMPMRY